MGDKVRRVTDWEMQGEATRALEGDGVSDELEKTKVMEWVIRPYG